MNDPLIIIVDSDGIAAQSNLNDANHKLAVKIAEKIVDLGAKVIYPSTTVFESTTVMARKYHNPQMAAGTLPLFADSLVINFNKLTT